MWSTDRVSNFRRRVKVALAFNGGVLAAAAGQLTAVTLEVSPFWIFIPLTLVCTLLILGLPFGSD